MDSFDGRWLDQELAGSSFADERLDQRLRKLVEQLEGAMGESLPLACQDWANTKAAYRFFSNERVSEAEILAGHFQSTAGRFATAEGPILVLQDTTEFTYKRERPDLVGRIGWGESSVLTRRSAFPTARSFRGVARG